LTSVSWIHSLTWLKPYRWRLILGILCLLGVSACTQAVPVVLKMAIDLLEKAKNSPAAVDWKTTQTGVALLALAIAGLAMGQAIIRIASRLLVFDVARKGEFDLRNAAFRHLLRLPPSFYRRSMTGDLMSRLTIDVQVLRQMWGPALLNIVNTCFAYTVALSFMLRLSPTLTLWALLPYPFLVGAAVLFARRLFRLVRNSQAAVGRLAAAAQEDLAGVGVVKAYALEESRGKAFAGRSHEVLDLNVQVAAARGQMMPLLAALGAVGTVLVIWQGGQLVSAGQISQGTLIAFNAYVGLLLFPTLALGWTMSVFQRGGASYRRILELLRVEPTLVDGPLERPPQIAGNIEVRDLTVAVGERKILDRVSMTIPAGQTVALVGPTGAGKTTLIDALARALEIPAGTIFLDGRDVTALPLDSVRAATGYAPQDAFLFSASIADNVAFGRPSTEPRELRDQVIARAVAAAGLERDLAALPDGLETMVGERGITLSGGQRQRVALARALAAEPRILLLDDSLSSVDSHTEREILDRLAAERQGRTVVMVSHRPTVTAQADVIMVLDQGQLVESGQHDELMQRGGVYAELYRERRREELAA
jgi:ATP-binding cassette subfamily B protein